MASESVTLKTRAEPAECARAESANRLAPPRQGWEALPDLMVQRKRLILQEEIAEAPALGVPD
jgi:hypothetical protein